jgi:hypothetical protein
MPEFSGIDEVKSLEEKVKLEENKIISSFHYQN